MAHEHLQKLPEGATEGERRMGGLMQQGRRHSPEHKYKASCAGEGWGAQAVQGNWGSLEGVTLTSGGAQFPSQSHLPVERNTHLNLHQGYFHLVC